MNNLNVQKYRNSSLGVVMPYVLFLGIAVLLNAGSSFFYKYSSLNSEKRTISIILLLVGLGLGAINAVFYTKSLKGIKLNTAYPIFSAGSLVLVSIISLVFFREMLSVQKIIGICLLIAGVVIVSL
jgi:multidrug transporter EmrE-like cation transporter